MSFWRANNTLTGKAHRGAIICLSLLLLGLGGCNGSKSLAKKGDQLMEAGLYTDAALFYYNSLMRNRNNVEARIGLAQSGQRVFNDKIDAFTKARAMEMHKEAVYNFLEAQSYREKIERLGLKLEMPDYMNTDFDESKGFYIKDLYNKGNDLMAEKRFDEANGVFKEIATLEPNYKDITELKNISKNEPIYLTGTELFDKGKYRQAYYEFDAIYRADPNYKDVAVLRDECLDKGKYTIAIAPFDNATKQRDIEKRINAFVITELSSMNDPFLRFVERENLELILNEQRLSLSGVVDESTAAQVGSLLGAKAILTGTVLSFVPQPGRLQVTEKNGYEGYQVKLYNKAEDKNYYEMRYKPVKYNEYHGTNQVSVSFQYKAISLESGEVLFSKVVNRNMESSVYYASYAGEPTKLFPANSQGVVTSNRDRNKLMSLIRANREMKSVDQLSNEAYEDIAEEISSELHSLIRNL